MRSEPRQGKGNVVRRMFADIEADIYILVDGDDTYDASRRARCWCAALVDGGYDIVSGRRIAVADSAYRAGHVLGNRLLTGLTAMMFRVKLADLLTGYRVMSRRFVKSFPFTAEGFGIETELTVHAVRLLMPMVEIDTKYKERPAGSVSKLNTYRDGFRILFTIAGLVREERPLIFFTAIFAIAGAAVAAHRHAGGDGISAHRPGAAPAHRGAGDGLDAAGVSLAGERADPRHGDARALGS